MGINIYMHEAVKYKAGREHPGQISSVLFCGSSGFWKLQATSLTPDFPFHDPKYGVKCKISNTSK